MIMLSFMSVSGAVTEEEKYLRGVWLSSVKNLDFPSKPGLSSEQLKKELDDVIATCKSAGINAVFFNVRPFADAQ